MSSMRRDPGRQQKQPATTLRPVRVYAGGASCYPRGMALVTALFLMLALGLLTAALVIVAPLQQAGAAMDLRGARAYQAATAALEWGIYQVLQVKPSNCPASTSLSFSDGLSGYNAVVQCSQVPGNGVQENGIGQVSLYVITATASSGAAGGPDYVERQVQATLSRCTSNSSLKPSAVC